MNGIFVSLKLLFNFESKKHKRNKLFLDAVQKRTTENQRIERYFRFYEFQCKYFVEFIDWIIIKIIF